MRALFSTRILFREVCSVRCQICCSCADCGAPCSPSLPVVVISSLNLGQSLLMQRCSQGCTVLMLNRESADYAKKASDFGVGDTTYSARAGSASGQSHHSFMIRMVVFEFLTIKTPALSESYLKILLAKARCLSRSRPTET